MIPDNNIDSLFKDLKDLEVSPSNRVWEGVENRLDKKKKRVIPVFWRIGVAASVLLAIGWFLFNTEEFYTSDNQIVDMKSLSEDDLSGIPSIAQNEPGAGQKDRQNGDELTTMTVKDDGDNPELSHEEKQTESSKSFIAENSIVRTGDSAAQSLKHTTIEERENEDVFFEKMVAHSFNPDDRNNGFPDTHKLPNPGEYERMVMIDDPSSESLSDIQKQKNTVRFIVGGEYSPTYAFRETSGGVSNNSESGINKAGGGISLAMKVNDRLQIETGVKYAMLGQEVKTISRSDRVYSFASNASEKSMDITEVNLSNSLGSVTPNASPSRMEDAAGFQGSSNALVELQSSDFSTSKNPLLEQNLGYLQIPLTLRYRVLEQSNVSLSLSGGISTNWLVDNNAYLEMGGDKKRVGQTQGVADMGLSTHAGVAVSLPVFKGIHLRMEPRIDYFLSDVSQDAPGTFRPYSFGVFTGLFYEW